MHTYKYTLRTREVVFFMCPRFQKIKDDATQYLDAAGFPGLNVESMTELTGVLRDPRGLSTDIDDKTTEHEEAEGQEEGSRGDRRQ